MEEQNEDKSQNLSSEVLVRMFITVPKLLGQAFNLAFKNAHFPGKVGTSSFTLGCVYTTCATAAAVLLFCTCYNYGRRFSVTVVNPPLERW